MVVDPCLIQAANKGFVVRSGHASDRHNGGIGGISKSNIPSVHLLGIDILYYRIVAPKDESLNSVTHIVEQNIIQGHQVIVNVNNHSKAVRCQRLGD
ncbi:MAG: hypothetical protein ACYS17_10015 [Planctomycetota bacterium]|jgi:hypothetical protein